jgi:hypothetical protein
MPFILFLKLCIAAVSVFAENNRVLIFCVTVAACVSNSVVNAFESIFKTPLVNQVKNSLNVTVLWLNVLALSVAMETKNNALTSTTMILAMLSPILFLLVLVLQWVFKWCGPPAPPVQVAPHGQPRIAGAEIEMTSVAVAGATQKKAVAQPARSGRRKSGLPLQLHPGFD